MKKLIAVLLTLVLTLSLAVVAFAAPAAPATTNANYGPGTSTVEQPEVTVRIGGNGNSARLIAYVDGEQAFVSPARPANNTTTTLRFDGFVVAVFVRGNSIMDVNVLESPVIPYVPTRTGESEKREVAGSREESGREITDSSVGVTVHRVNQNHGAHLALENGAHLVGWASGSATLTVSYKYLYNMYYKYTDGVFRRCVETGEQEGTDSRDVNDSFGFTSDDRLILSFSRTFGAFLVSVSGPNNASHGNQISVTVTATIDGVAYPISVGADDVSFTNWI